MDRRIILIHTWAMNGGVVTGSLNSSKRWCRKKPLALVKLVKLAASIFGVTKHVW